jgi:hypothetical protein
MPAWQFAAIEEELRAYPVTLMQIITAREEAVTQRREERIGKGYGVPNPTCATVEKLCSKEIARMERVADAIDATYKALKQSSYELAQVVRLYYWRRERAVDVSRYLGVSTSTLWQWRRLVCGAVRWRLEGMTTRRRYESATVS